jgi:hypothetical protein
VPTPTPMAEGTCKGGCDADCGKAARQCGAIDQETGSKNCPTLTSRSAWARPLTHPIKGNFSTSSGEGCVCHVPGVEFYGRAKPERCYATEQDAVQDGCRPSKR